MARSNKGKDIGKKNAKNKQCKIAQSCNISDSTNSVEFANEPFNDNKKDKVKDTPKDEC